MPVSRSLTGSPPAEAMESYSIIMLGAASFSFSSLSVVAFSSFCSIVLPLGRFRAFRRRYRGHLDAAWLPLILTVLFTVALSDINIVTVRAGQYTPPRASFYLGLLITGRTVDGDISTLRRQEIFNISLSLLTFISYYAAPSRY